MFGLGRFVEERFEISEEREKIGESPAIAPFMPVVQYGTQPGTQSGIESTAPATAQSPFGTQAAARQFLAQCQQRAIAAKQPKIASLSFSVALLAPWTVLAALGEANTRHFYYDSPYRDVFQHRSMVGIGTVVECRAAGNDRFAEAQSFIDFWQPHFCTANLTPSGSDPVNEHSSGPVESHSGAHSGVHSGGRNATQRGHFFCSATFFEDRHPVAHFEPTYVFVPRVQVSAQRQFSTVTFNGLVAGSSDVDQMVAGIYRQLEKIVLLGQQARSRANGTHYRSAGRHRLTKDVVGFEQTVRSVLTQMRSHAVHKVVLSDVADVVMPSPVDVVRSLQALHHNHPDCTVFSVGNGRGQSFIGASPERLLRISSQGGRRELMTEALAGTTSRSHDPGLDIQLGQSLLNSKKERYEHRVVVEFILDQLRSLELTPHHSASPQLLKLLNLQHLHTPIKAALSDKSVHPLAVLAKLHPTPAVAGVPRQLARVLIREYESFDRGLYTAPIGWIDTDGNSEFIVGIRSALIDGCKARLYAGAGIVSGSEPKKELAEIRLKLQALLNALVCV
ncbi:MAG: isochorismate synthase MenF [Phormidesmis sp.]